MYKGSCLCGAVRYEIMSEPKAISNCYCTLCQKQHGAAFATYGSVPKKDMVYLSGESALTTYRSSSSIIRRFCSICGSNMDWSGSTKYPDWVSFAVASLDTPFTPNEVTDIHTDTKACWLVVG